MKALKTLVAVATALLAGAAQADITIGISLPLTGPASGLGIPMANYIKLWPTSIAGEKLNVIVLDNHGFSSIGGLSRSIGSGTFGTDYKMRTESGHLDGGYVPMDFAKLCQGYGAKTVRVRTRAEFEAAVAAMASESVTTAVVIEVDKETRVPGYESWWDVPISEVSGIESIREARAKYEVDVQKERHHGVAAGGNE